MDSSKKDEREEKEFSKVSDKNWQKYRSLRNKLDLLSEKQKKKEELKAAKKKRPTCEEKYLNKDQPPTADAEDIEKVNDKGDGKKNDSNWLELRPYIDINSHLIKTTGTTRKPKNSLERKIDEALSKNEISKAFELNDRLASREFSKKIIEACDAKRYVEKLKSVEEMKKSKKKRRYPWGFEQKQRWETKGNM
ncbi:hypothetical protein HELRODRAFT_161665 [Helobdella robusta]|uniref:Protein FAM204A n=1 Tax=Helobdella robusta TaxID=6412 RepID=T1ERR6_HELRO|nr:hypothetical protein HELRODRAFT_161665 [Helobdella robusta]ESO02398.1 hypothetical protein HELRODRAFT_161665 [Helobdella robusta]